MCNPKLLPEFFFHSAVCRCCDATKNNNNTIYSDKKAHKGIVLFVRLTIFFLYKTIFYWSERQKTCESIVQLKNNSDNDNYYCCSCATGHKIHSHIFYFSTFFNNIHKIGRGGWEQTKNITKDFVVVSIVHDALQ